MDRRKLLRRIHKLHELYRKGEIVTPEKHVVDPGLEPGSNASYVFYTLPCSINFRRSSPAMWESALKTYQDSELRYLFNPVKVVDESKEKIKKDLIKYKLALQTNRHTDIWLRISDTIANYYNNNPKNILKEGKYDVKKILSIIQDKKKHLFPYLGGIKLSNYWLFILSRFTDIKFTNEHEISIIPDTHIIKSSVRLGLVNEEASSKDVENAWKELLKTSNLNPVDMHSVLWNWSRSGFNPEV